MECWEEASLPRWCSALPIAILLACSEAPTEVEEPFLPLAGRFFELTSQGVRRVIEFTEDEYHVHVFNEWNDPVWQVEGVYEVYTSINRYRLRGTALTVLDAEGTSSAIATPFDMPLLLGEGAIVMDDELWTEL